MLGSRSFHQVPVGKSRLFEAVAHGKRHTGLSKKDGKKDPVVKGLETLMNRSELKGIVDHTERSRALGDDIVKKMASLETATGKGAKEVLKMIGERS
jgi:hypothetical protein